MNRERAPVHKLLPRDEHHWCALAPKHIVKIKRVSRYGVIISVRGCADPCLFQGDIFTYHLLSEEGGIEVLQTLRTKGTDRLREMCRQEGEGK